MPKTFFYQKSQIYPTPWVQNFEKNIFLENHSVIPIYKRLFFIFFRNLLANTYTQDKNGAISNHTQAENDDFVKFYSKISKLSHPSGSKFQKKCLLETHSVIPIYKTKMIQFHILPYLL